MIYLILIFYGEKNSADFVHSVVHAWTRSKSGGPCFVLTRFGPLWHWMLREQKFSSHDSAQVGPGQTSRDFCFSVVLKVWTSNRRILVWLLSLFVRENVKGTCNWDRSRYHVLLCWSFSTWKGGNHRERPGKPHHTELCCLHRKRKIDRWCS